GDQQRGDLEPDAALGAQPGQRVLHVLQVGAAEVAIEALTEGFQIDVGGIDVFVEFAARFGRDVAGGDGDGFQAGRVARTRGVHGVFQEDHRVVVGERHRTAAELARGGGDHLGRGGRVQPVDLARLGDVPVLAELAGEVAT